MYRKLLAMMVGLVVFFAVSMASAQPAAPSTGQPAGLCMLTGDDAKHAKQLLEQVDEAMKGDRWDEAIAHAEELVALQKRVQGEKHYETVHAVWLVKTLRHVASGSKDDRTSYLSTFALMAQGDALQRRGKYAAAQPLYEKVLAICRRILGEDHPDTATSPTLTTGRRSCWRAIRTETVLVHEDKPALTHRSERVGGHWSLATDETTDGLPKPPSRMIAGMGRSPMLSSDFRPARTAAATKNLPIPQDSRN